MHNTTGIEENVASKAIREKIEIKPETIKNLAGQNTTYRYYLYDILVAKIEIEISNDKSLPIYEILDFSTINFQGKQDELYEYNFKGIQKIYQASRDLLEKSIGQRNIPQLGSMIFEDIIGNIRLLGDKYVQLQTALTSKGFYRRICTKLKEKELIDNFKLTKKGWLQIEVKTRNFT